jgi:hypothetical protein
MSATQPVTARAQRSAEHQPTTQLIIARRAIQLLYEHQKIAS